MRKLTLVLIVALTFITSSHAQVVINQASVPTCVSGNGLLYTSGVSPWVCVAAYGAVGYFNTTGTAITISSSSDGSTNMVLVGPTTALNANTVGFDNGGGNTGRLRYTGTPTRVIRVTATISGTAATTTDSFVVGLAKNGTVDATTKVISKFDTASVTVSGIISLATNDYIEVYVGNLTAGRNLTVKTLSVLAGGSQ